MKKITSQTPFVYSYGRRSTDKQDITEAVQKERCETLIKYHRSMGKIGEDVVDGGWWYDTKSGKTPWFLRDKGEELFRRLQPGDCVIVSKLDRCSRSLSDFCYSINLLEQKGVAVKFVDPDLDTSTPVGRLICHILASFAEFEREIMAERTREGLQWKKSQGLPVSGFPPMGWKKIGKGKDSRFIPDIVEQNVCNMIYAMHVEQEMSFYEIHIEMRKQGIKFSPAINAGIVKKGVPIPWSQHRVFQGFHAARLGFNRETQKEVRQIIKDMSGISGRGGPRRALVARPA